MFNIVFLSCVRPIAQFFCERSITLLVLLYKIVVHKNEIKKYLGRVSQARTLRLFSVKNYKTVLKKLKNNPLMRTVELTRAGTLRQTYF